NIATKNSSQDSTLKDQRIRLSEPCNGVDGNCASSQCREVLEIREIGIHGFIDWIISQSKVKNEWTIVVAAGVGIAHFAKVIVSMEAIGEIIRHPAHGRGHVVSESCMD